MVWERDIDDRSVREEFDNEGEIDELAIKGKGKYVLGFVHAWRENFYL